VPIATSAPAADCIVSNLAYRPPELVKACESSKDPASNNSFLAIHRRRFFHFPAPAFLLPSVWSDDVRSPNHVQSRWLENSSE